MTQLEENPYFQFEKQSLILRDYLAADRTVLSVDRTILSYIRTALTFLIAGVSFIKFFNTPILIIVGWLFLFLTPILLLIGVMRALDMKKLITSLKQTDEKMIKKHEDPAPIFEAPTSSSVPS